MTASIGVEVVEGECTDYLLLVYCVYDMSAFGVTTIVVP